MSNINDNKRESYAVSGETIAEQVSVLEGGGGGGGGSGTVTTISVATANGISASITNATTTPELTFTLGAITPTSVNGLTITTTTGTFTLTAAKVFSVTGTLTLSGTDGSTLNIGTGGTLGTGAYATISNYATIASLGTGAFATIGDYVLTSSLSAYALLAGATFTGLVKVTVSGTPLSLTNPTIQATNSVDNFTQVSIQNKSAGVNASADMIAYPDNNSNDTTGFADMGITSSAYAQAAYAITTPNDAYFFASAVSGASKLGNMILCTDSTGSSNSIIFGVNGFTSLNKERARIDGATGAFSYGYASVANGINKFYNSSNSNTVTIQSGVTSGSYTLTLPTAAPAGNGYVLSSTTGGVLSWASAAGGFSWGTSVSSGSGIGLAMTTTDLVGDKPFLTMAHTASGTLVATTTTQASLAISRTHTTASSITDNFIGFAFSRTNVMNQAGGTLLAQGPVVSITGTDIQTAGILTPSYDLLALAPSLLSTGSSLSITVPNSVVTAPTNGHIYAVLGNTQTLSQTLITLNTGTATLNGMVGINIIHKGGSYIIDHASGAITINSYGAATQAVSNEYGLAIGSNFNTNSVFSNVKIFITNQNNAGVGSNTGMIIYNYSTEFQLGSTGSGLVINQAGIGGNAIHLYGIDNVNSSTNGLVNYTISNTQSGATVMQKIDLGTSAQGHTGLLVNTYNASTTLRGIKIDSSTTGTGAGIEITGGAGTAFDTAGILFTASGSKTFKRLMIGTGASQQDTTSSNIGFAHTYFSTIDNGATLGNKTQDLNSFLHHRYSTSSTGTTADNFNMFLIKRSNTQQTAGGTFTSAGSVLKLENVATQTAGTLTDTVVILSLVQSANSTGLPLSITQNAVVTTNFRKILGETNTGINIWMSNGTDPNGTLTGTAGDICLNGATNKPAYCTGTTVWVNFV